VTVFQRPHAPARASALPPLPRHRLGPLRRDSLAQAEGRRTARDAGSANIPLAFRYLRIMGTEPSDIECRALFHPVQYRAPRVLGRAPHPHLDCTAPTRPPSASSTSSWTASARPLCLGGQHDPERRGGILCLWRSELLAAHPDGDGPDGRYSDINGIVDYNSCG